MSLSHLLDEIAQGAGQLSWDAWFVFVATAEGNPAAWNEAWLSLSNERRSLFLSRLARDAGPLADSLVELCATHVDVEPDPLVREVLHQDAAEAAARTADRLRCVRDRVGAEVTALRAPVDLAEEVARLRAERDGLRAALEANPDHQARVELEQELERLGTFLRSLQAYDRPAREAERCSLQARTAELADARRALEQQMREAIEQRSEAEQAIALQQERLASAIAERDAAQQRAEQLSRDAGLAEEDVRRTQGGQREWQARLADQKRQLTELGDDISRLAQETEAARAAVAQAVRTRDELRQRQEAVRPQWERALQEVQAAAQRHEQARALVIADMRAAQELHAQQVARLEEHLRMTQPPQASPPAPPAPPPSAPSSRPRWLPFGGE